MPGPEPRPGRVGRPASTDPSRARPVPAAGPAPLRVVFMGTPEFAVPCLEALLDSEDEVVAVVAQPDKPAGRGNKLKSPPTVELARARSIPVYQPKALRSGAFPPALAALGADLFVVVAYGRILPADILAMPRLGCINVHGSLLPAYRGAGPIQWALLRGEVETGVTTMFMDVGMDTGDMLEMASLPITPEDTSQSLHDKLAPLGAALLRETILHLKDGSLTRSEQDHAAATMAPMLAKDDGAIDWARPARDLDWHVRGMYPWPGAFTFRGDQRLVITAGIPLPDGQDGAAPGAILGGSQAGIPVATGAGVYRISRVKPAGKREMEAAEYLRGHPVRPGECLGPGSPDAPEGDS